MRFFSLLLLFTKYQEADTKLTQQIANINDNYYCVYNQNKHEHVQSLECKITTRNLAFTFFCLQQ